MATEIRKSQNIKGLKIHNHVYKILQFADDAIVIAKDKDDIKSVLRILRSFSRCSGLHINIDKSEIIQLGPGLLFDTTIAGINISKNDFKYLGIWFSSDIVQQEYKNFRHRLDVITNLFKIWKQRDLSLRGKIVIIRSLALSQLLYAASFLNVPEWVVREANKLFYGFLWDNKPDKLKRDIITRDIKAGGLKMVDVETMIYSLKIKWAKKLYKDSTHKWTNIVNYYFNPISIKHFMSTSYIEEYLPPLLPRFYRQCLIALLEVKPCYDLTVVNNVLLQRLWFNSNIQIAKKPVFYKHWYNKGIKCVGDIVDKNGLLLLPDQIQERFDLEKMHFLEYYALRNAIPYKWKDTLRVANKVEYVENHGLDVEIKGISRDLKYTSNKEVYWSMIAKSKTSPIPAERYWIRSLGVPEVHMKKYYEIPYLYMRQTKIQTMQYKILHNFYACNLKLYKWKIVNSNKCLHCEITDTLEHHFFECVHMQVFWRSFCGWWKNYCVDCCPNDIFTCKQVILGVIERVCHKPQLNYLLLLAKWYVFKVKYLQGRCFFLDFLSDVKVNLNIEQNIYKVNNNYHKYLELWYELHTLL